MQREIKTGQNRHWRADKERSRPPLKKPKFNPHPPRLPYNGASLTQTGIRPWTGPSPSAETGKRCSSIIAALFALAGFTAPRNRGEVSPAQPVTERGLPRHILAAILLVLRPAESAVRRLHSHRCSSPSAENRDSLRKPRAADAGLANRLQDCKYCPAICAPRLSPCSTRLKFRPGRSLERGSRQHYMRFQSGFDTVLDPASGFRALRDKIPAAHIQRLPPSDALRQSAATGSPPYPLASPARCGTQGQPPNPYHSIPPWPSAGLAAAALSRSRSCAECANATGWRRSDERAGHR